MVLRDGTWSYGTDHGFTGRNMDLRDGTWFCRTKHGFCFFGEIILTFIHIILIPASQNRVVNY